MSIQYLRAIAALMVVFYHLCTRSDGLFIPIDNVKFGKSGVDIFFVISGFIMYSAARREAPIEFLRRRLIRIAPLYWIVTLLVATMVVARGNADAYGLSIVHLVKSLLFIPQYSPAHEGEIYPLLVPGWTLNYEMFFYIIFAIGLFIGKPLTFCCVILTILPIIGEIFQPQDAIGKTYCNIVLLEFVTGLLIAASLHRWPVKSLGFLVLPGLAGIILAESAGAWENMTVLLSASAIVAGAVSLELAGRMPSIPALTLVGSASFSIYLTHFNMLNPLRGLFRNLPLSGWPQFLIFSIFGALSSIALGIFFYIFVERPILRLIRHKQSGAAAIPSGA